MTDKEIIVEALEHCVSDDCGGCPNLATEYCSTPQLFDKEVLSLIKSQQAEIERLQSRLKKERHQFEDLTYKKVRVQSLLQNCRRNDHSNIWYVSR